ncbi:DUF5047 domain-containing protein [Streptomyces sp. NBC_01216]|uniref:DUF5047 domain-containing protein n=1 Tax=Streptomyces sp. NBC_01216 TaxID=2903778 RepID=UPI002E0F10C5|nr:DUF5047 domain-containing protein [Streptomyces sp. NBC_01216]
MLDMSDRAQAVVQRSHTMHIRAEAWLGGRLLADSIPIADGTETRDRSLAVPERITLTVPRTDRGTRWDPIEPDAPLAAYGQQLRIDYGVDTGGHTEWINRGWFLVSEAETDEETVTVTALGLLALIDEAKFTAPFQPASGDTLASTVRALVEPALTVLVDSSLTDRAVPLGMQWDDDRIAALHEVLGAWPADARVTEDGYLQIEPLTDTGTPLLDLTDGVGGTVVHWQGTASRDGAYNAVVAAGEDAAGNQVQGVAYDQTTGSPLRYGGPFSPLPVPYHMYSPLLRTISQCRTAAATTLTRLRRTASRRLTITCVPHPGLMTGDVVTVTGAGLVSQPCVIESLSLPYSPGAMTLTVRVI